MFHLKFILYTRFEIKTYFIRNISFRLDAENARQRELELKKKISTKVVELEVAIGSEGNDFMRKKCEHSALMEELNKYGFT